MTTRVSHDEINRRTTAKLEWWLLNNKDFEKLKKFQKGKRKE